jgi:hypothetical protein
MTEAQIERQLDARLSRRMKAEARMLDRIEKREEKAIQMIGELGSGKFYIYPPGGRYRESASRLELIDFLIRNRYV